MGHPDKLLLISLVACLEDLGVDIAGIRTSAIRNVASNVNEFAFLLAGRARIGWRHHINGIAATIAFKDSHLVPP